MTIFVTWPQWIAGGGGVAFIAVGAVTGGVLLRVVHGRGEPAPAIAYIVVTIIGMIASGICFVLAAINRWHFWEVTGSIVIAAAYLVRWLLGRWMRWRYHDDELVD